MTDSLPYGDLTDTEWSLIEPLLSKSPGRLGGYDLRLVVNGILFLMRSGSTLCTGPPWSTAEAYYSQWQADGTWDRIMATLQSGRPGIGLPPDIPPKKEIANDCSPL